MASVPPAGAIPIKDREDYLACPDGRIYSTRRKIFLKPAPTRRGRLIVKLPRLNRQPGEATQVSLDVAALICVAFHGERPINLTVSHLNGDQQDNRAENLKWETLKENTARRYEHGTAQDGFRNSRAKLSPKDVACIRAWGKLGITRKRIAEALGVSATIVSLVMNGKSYIREVAYDGEIPEFPLPGKNLRSRLTKDQVIAIRLDDRPQKFIAAEYGISQVYVSGIKNRSRRSDVE